MEVKPLSKAEIIDETAAYYTARPRSIVGDVLRLCVYRGPNGERCAFSRCVEPDKVHLCSDGKGPANLLVEYGEDLMQERYRGHRGGDFWLQLQRLHDAVDNWETSPDGQTNTLTPAGQRAVRVMKEEYAEA